MLDHQTLYVLQLKILACNVSGGEQQGHILVNGSPVHPKVFKNQSAVVWQSDVLLASATVSEFAPITMISNKASCYVHPLHIPLVSGF